MSELSDLLFFHLLMAVDIILHASVTWIFFLLLSYWGIFIFSYLEMLMV